MVELPEHFTAHNDTSIDDLVASHVARVGEEVSRVLGDLRALFLVGGFARGEGSVLVEEQGPRPVNDYDFVVITESRREWPLLPDIGRRLAREIGIRGVDLLPLRTRDLPGLRHTIFNYDLTTCGRLVAGDGAVRRFFPRLLPGHIPLSEGRILLVNRMFCLLESLERCYLDDPPAGEAAFFCSQQASKAVLACQDALLVMRRRYHHRYMERMLRLQEEACPIDGLMGLSRQATAFKLRPVSVAGEDAVRMWLGGRRVLLAGLQLIMNEGRWERLEELYLRRSLKDRLREATARLRGARLSRAQAMIEMAELWTLVSMDEPGAVRRLARAAEWLSEAGFPVKEPSSWEHVRKRAVEAWMEVTH
jgi:hypothetical protein